MDAAYLKKNVNGALREAITSMAVLCPDDPVEFLGQYLLKYVDRKNEEKILVKELAATEEKLKAFQISEDEKVAAQKEEDDKKMKKEQAFEEFVQSISTSKSKDAAMNLVVSFMESDMGIPAAYIAVKRTVGETETLHYLSAGPNAKTNVLGKKLKKASAEEAGDEENPVERLGISFEAFKVPEVPEGEEEEPEGEEGADKPPKPKPVPQPIIVDNAMRDKRCKFFGIPKHGAYVACPFSYESPEHETACTYTEPNADEGVAGGYSINNIKAEFMIAFDSVGQYKLFTSKDVEKINKIGEKLASVFASLEETSATKHLEFVKGSGLGIMAELGDPTTKVGELEGAAMADIAKKYDDLAAQDPPPENPPHELLRPAEEAAAVTDALNKAFVGDLTKYVDVLNQHILPLPVAAVSLLYVIGKMVGITEELYTDVSGEPSWSKMRTDLLPVLISSMSVYEPFATMTVASTSSMANLKAIIEAGNLLDGGTYPPNLPVLGALMIWLQKAMAAREAAMAYSLEAKQTNLEVLL